MHYIKISFEVIADRKRNVNVIWQLSAELLGTPWTVWGRGSGLKSGLLTTALATSMSAFQLKWCLRLRKKKKKLTGSLCHFLILIYDRPRCFPRCIFLIKREDMQSSMDVVEIKSANEQISSSLSPEHESSQALVFTPNHFICIFLLTFPHCSLPLACNHLLLPCSASQTSFIRCMNSQWWWLMIRHKGPDLFRSQMACTQDRLHTNRLCELLVPVWQVIYIN